MILFKFLANKRNIKYKCHILLITPLKLYCNHFYNYVLDACILAVFVFIVKRNRKTYTNE